MIEPFSAKGIAGRIHAIRGDRVMLDADLAALYGVPTRRLNEQVRRRRDYLALAFTDHSCLMLSNVLNGSSQFTNERSTITARWTRLSMPRPRK
jgi:hypothetical protein